MFGFRIGSKAGGGVDLKAFNFNEISNTQDVIENWIKNAENYIDNVGQNAKGIMEQHGIRGEAQQDAIVAWIERAMDEVRQITAELRKFSTDLTAIEQSYQSQSGAVGGNLSGLNVEETTLRTGFND